ncbi:MAG: hypothetical protein KME32_23150 [Mojavia pulchra JT2-VF2]|jgi:type I restriction enzyme M protein|uniref:Uncharacterized protein n=1 Tax=Mojavia pulchra JT2-VF2 TaxID=287848 RepID=A0A951Q1E4_9NOST|nr:hypothetical protein [Mojavia pulchra JT2-VF2]
MRAIEAENEELKDILPKTYNRLENDLLFDLLKNFNKVELGTDLSGNAFGSSDVWRQEAELLRTFDLDV